MLVNGVCECLLCKQCVLVLKTQYFRCIRTYHCLCDKKVTFSFGKVTENFCGYTSGVLKKIQR